MSAELIIAIAGAVFTFVIMIGGIIVRDRFVMKNIREGDDKLHERINGAHERFVRRDELSQQLNHFSEEIKGVRTEVHSTNNRLDQLLVVMTNQGGNP